jgi:hypothetical protein
MGTEKQPRYDFWLRNPQISSIGCPSRIAHPQCSTFQDMGQNWRLSISPGFLINIQLDQGILKNFVEF